jgi:hypothetical protein
MKKLLALYGTTGPKFGHLEVSLLYYLRVRRQVGSSAQLRDHARHLGGDGHVHVTHVVDLLLCRVVELEEEHHIRILKSTLLAFFLGHCHVGKISLGVCPMAIPLQLCIILTDRIYTSVASLYG